MDLFVLCRFLSLFVELPSNRIYVGEGQRVGVGAVCQEDEDALVFRIDPEGCAGESVVAETIRRQINAAG